MFFIYYLFKENDKLTYSELKNTFIELNKNTFEELLSKLMIKGILKNFNGYNNENSNYFKFIFVGIVIFKNIVIFVYPKYIRNINDDFNNGKAKFKQILAVIKKYKKDNSLSIQTIEQNNVELQLELLNDFFLNGLYLRNKDKLVLYGENEIDWANTIERSLPYIINGSPIYLDLFSQEQDIDEENMVRQLHKKILTEISNNLAPLLNILNIEEVKFNESYGKVIDEKQYLNYLLETEKSKQFISSQIEIIDKLINYINDNINKKEMNIYGTKNFNLVWEEVCKVVYKNNLNDSLLSTHLEYQGEIRYLNKKQELNYDKNLKIKELVSKPIWYSNKLDEYVESKKTFELDVMNVNHNNKTLNIYDGKYYTMKIDSNKIQGQPGTYDIVKQYIYQLNYQKLAVLNNYRFNNIFVLPYDELKNDNGKGVFIGNVKIDILDELGLEKISLLGRDCYTFFKQYLNA